MSRKLRDHGVALSHFAAETERQAASDPNDWLLPIVAKNQRVAAEEILRAADIEDAQPAGEILDWRFIGNRLPRGEMPLDFLSRLAAPLNNLLVRAAYFARTGTEAMYGAADDLSREIGLSLVGLAPGSTRLIIRGNAMPDLTGASALSDGLNGIFGLMSTAATDAAGFYDRLDDIGERASEALHGTLKAIEGEECSVEVTWHGAAAAPRVFAVTFDRVVQLRTMLEGVQNVHEVQERLVGQITLLSTNGRIQLVLHSGQRVTVRFKPKSQATLVANLTLNAAVSLDVVAKVSLDPISGDEIKRYSLVSLDAPLLLTS